MKVRLILNSVINPVGTYLHRYSTHTDSVVLTRISAIKSKRIYRTSNVTNTLWNIMSKEDAVELVFKLISRNALGSSYYTGREQERKTVN